MKRYKKTFILFLERCSEFNKKEKKQIIHSLENRQVFLVFRLALLLLGWSIIMAFVDFFIISGLVVYIFMHSVGIGILTVPVAFLIINIVFKFITVCYMSKGRISYTILIVASLPYVGFAFLLGHTLQKNPLFRKALLRYISYQKEKILKFY